jgi:hypothetical protein
MVTQAYSDVSVAKPTDGKLGSLPHGNQLTANANRTGSSSFSKSRHHIRIVRK